MRYILIHVFTEITESEFVFLSREISALFVDNGVNQIYPTEIIYLFPESTDSQSVMIYICV